MPDIVWSFRADTKRIQKSRLHDSEKKIRANQRDRIAKTTSPAFLQPRLNRRMHFALSRNKRKISHKWWLEKGRRRSCVMPCRPDFVAFLSHERQERKKERERERKTTRQAKEKFPAGNSFPGETPTTHAQPMLQIQTFCRSDKRRNCRSSRGGCRRSRDWLARGGINCTSRRGFLREWPFNIMRNARIATED